MKSLKFEWDLVKASSNIIKHGVSFEEAKTLLANQPKIKNANIVSFCHEIRIQLFAIYPKSIRQKSKKADFAYYQSGNYRIFKRVVSQNRSAISNPNQFMPNRPRNAPCATAIEVDKLTVLILRSANCAIIRQNAIGLLICKISNM